jgi:sugar phosphate isomerase/epimerase
MSLFDLLERACSLDIKVLQVADNLPLDQLSEEDLASFEARTRASGIQVEVGTRGIAVEHLRRCLDLAVRFKSPILRVVIDTPIHHPSPEEAGDGLLTLRPDFEKAGVLLAIENHDRFPATVLAGLVHRLGGWAGICLDTVNSFGALEGPQVVVEALGPLTVNLHIKDFTIFRASHNMGFTIEGRPAGQGKLDLPWLLEALRGYGRDPNAILELWTPPEENLPGTLSKEQRWVEESVAYLRTLIPG